jgi:aryl-alcohol dehydrogenase-like predicted oxidoreductase
VIATRPLGDSGIHVPVVGLGCNNFGRRIDLDSTRAVVDAALDEGVTFFDTANTYGRGQSEEFLGEVLEGRRDQVTLATKFGMDMGDGETARGRRGYVRRALEDSLGRLRTDRVDLLYYHRPDGVTPFEETLEAMNELADEGKARQLAVSNLTVEQLDEVVAIAAQEGLTPVVALQNEYSLLEREAERDVLPRCRELGLGFVPYFPLASGMLTGKYRRGEAPPEGTRLHGQDDRLTPEVFDTIERLEGFARERGHSLLELAIAALASRPEIPSVIAGATRAEQVRANAAAAEWMLDAEELAALSRLGAAAAG